MLKNNKKAPKPKVFSRDPVMCRISLILFNIGDVRFSNPTVRPNKDRPTTINPGKPRNRCIIINFTEKLDSFIFIPLYFHITPLSAVFWL
jgi:hypothetical protein